MIAFIKKHDTFLATVAAAICTALLRVFDGSCAVSMLLALGAITFIIYTVRSLKRRIDVLHLLILLLAAFVIRDYGYTNDPFADLMCALGSAVLVLGIFLLERILFSKFYKKQWSVIIVPFMYSVLLVLAELIGIVMPFRLDTYFADLTIFAQIVSVGTLYIIDFLVVLTASIIVYYMQNGFKKENCAVWASYIVLIAIVLAFGGWRMSTCATDSSQDKVKVSFSTPSFEGIPENMTIEEYSLDNGLNFLNNAANDAKKDNSQILIFSESSFHMKDYDEDYFMRVAGEMAKFYGLNILLPCNIYDTNNSNMGKTINKISWVDKQGNVSMSYDKSNVIPVVESLRYVCSDQSLQTHQIEAYSKLIDAASVICYDADFELFMAQAPKDLNALFVPSWDWSVFMNQHLDLLRLRAISTNSTVVCPEHDGWCCVIDKAGNLVEKFKFEDVSNNEVKTVEVPLSNVESK